MSGVVRMLVPGPIHPVPLLNSIRTGVIERFGRGYGFSVTRNATVHSCHDNSGYRIINHRGITAGKARCTPGEIEEEGSKVGPSRSIKVPDITF